MEKITKPHKPDADKNIITEDINYFETRKGSIFGEGDSDTLKILNNVQIKGKWLNLAAGDGRYNNILLEKADFVIASDIDEGALSKLWHNTSKRYKEKLETKIFDITKKFPFDDCSFNGIFCTGTLHLFPKEILLEILAEMNRVLKSGGRIFIDFATDINRITNEGKPLKSISRISYTLDEAKTILKEVFKNFKIQIHESYVNESVEGHPPYKFTSKFIILIADKI